MPHSDQNPFCLAFAAIVSVLELNCQGSGSYGIVCPVRAQVDGGLDAG